MTTQLMRNYIDIVNEAQEPQQLDEGVIDTLAGKVKQLKDRFMAIPGAAQAFKQAEQHRGEIEQLAKSGKSSKEIIDSLKQMAGGGVIKEDELDAFRVGTGTLNVLLGIALPLINLYQDAWSMLSKMNMGPEKIQYLIGMIGVPLLMFTMGIFILWYTYDQHKERKRAKAQSQAFLDKQRLSQK
jgi:hypothetical protein